jgi:hypothetical protein
MVVVGFNLLAVYNNSNVFACSLSSETVQSVGVFVLQSNTYNDQMGA